MDAHNYAKYGALSHHNLMLILDITHTYRATSITHTRTHTHVMNVDDVLRSYIVKSIIFIITYSRELKPQLKL